MRYRKLGRWGMRVSAVGLGSWITYGHTVDNAAAGEIIGRAYDRGVTFFDTANVYAGGRAEEVVGKALAAYPRDSFVLATKVFFPMPQRGRPIGPNDRGLSRKHVTEQLHHSLRRLGTDYIDLYQCHRYDVDTPLEETARVMDDLIRAGKVLYWGVSEWSADQIAHAVELCRARGWAPPVSNQPEYNALQRRIEARVLPTCAEYGLGNVVWSPLAGGILTGKYTTVDRLPEGTRATGEDRQFVERHLRQDTLDAVAGVDELAKQAGCSTAQLALAWCLRQEYVSSVIVGATKIDHVDDNVAAADLDVDPALLAQVSDLLAPVAQR